MTRPNFDLETTVPLMPRWFSIEGGWAAKKYDGSCPQKVALLGGLAVDGPAYQDISQYFSRGQQFVRYGENFSGEAWS